MIQQDNEAACVGLVQLGAAVKVDTAASPKMDLENYPCLTVAGDTNGLALTLADVGSAKTYLKNHTAIKGNSTPEVARRS